MIYIVWKVSTNINIVLFKILIYYLHVFIKILHFFKLQIWSSESLNPKYDKKSAMAPQ